jgi:NADH dehydrogenase FAD-containing subunit
MGDAAIKMDVVVVGGGFAGVYCGKELAARMRNREDFHAVIVSDENYTVFQPMLPSVAASGISPRHVVNPIRQLCRGIEVFKGSVARIDPVEKRIHLDAGDFSPNLVVEFKDLVLTVGAKVDLSRVPGMPEHALLMQNVGDAMKVRATILGRFEEANLVSDPEIKRRLLTFVVVGGGYAGVETAGEILDLMKDIHRYYRKRGARRLRRGPHTQRRTPAAHRATRPVRLLPAHPHEARDAGDPRYARAGDHRQQRIPGRAARASRAAPSSAPWATAPTRSPCD